MPLWENTGRITMYTICDSCKYCKRVRLKKKDKGRRVRICTYEKKYFVKRKTNCLVYDNKEI